MKKITFCAIFHFLISIAVAQQADIKFYPTNWWINMKSKQLQLMVHGENIAGKFPLIKMSPQGISLAKGVRLVKIHRPENPNYIFLDLLIDKDAVAGKFTLPFVKDTRLEYELKNRQSGNGKDYAQGITSRDFIYLVMPDRFSNGDSSNDKFGDMLDTNLNRSIPLLRHGGDLHGIANHLDYLKELGITSLWLTPVLQNDMPLEKEPPGDMSGYHGYWITDHYLVDKRLGTNEDYRNLVKAAHAQGLKIIQDAVYNHVGEKHWFITDLPMPDWINQWHAYQGTHHREEVFIDPHASVIDKKIMVDGWFVPHLPDLNLANPYVSNFIIQNSIWATQEFGIDGWRVDTYKYNDEHFLNKINIRLHDEFPGLTVFGEVTSNTVTGSAYFTRNNIAAPFKHNLEGVCDFPLSYAMLSGMNEPFGWTNGVNKIYMTLAQDLLYKDPSMNCIFLDNHDMDRVYSVIGEDLLKFKMGINWLLTLRGIPQLYYGTEILMKNFKNPSDAEVRRDFPGGWAGDAENKFTSDGRTTVENEAFNYIKSLATYRKNTTALTTGKLMQYIPQNGLYVYFRYDSLKTIMVASNTAAAFSDIDLSRFSERVNGFSKMKNIFTNEITVLENFVLGKQECGIWELMK